ncbi:hypothetical protein SUGI_0039930 [Cryptomeria japonica]|nr:hypothetical protein SUGI_0039930 [Cryptomeria japonica]
MRSRRRTRTPESASPDKIKIMKSELEQVEQQEKQHHLHHLLHNLLTHFVQPRHPIGDCCDIRQLGDGGTFDSWAMVVPLTFREVESLEEAMIKIQFDGDGDSDEWVFEFVEEE